MKHTNLLLVVALIICVILLVLYFLYKSTRISNKSVKTEPAKIESVLGTQFKQVILTVKAKERLGIETSPVRQEWMIQSGSVRNVVPYASVLYGLQGETWLYVNPEPLTFMRKTITIDYIDADLAVLSDGPPPGTEAVTVGVAELYGIDTGVGK